MKIDKGRAQVQLSLRETQLWESPSADFNIREIARLLAKRVLLTAPLGLYSRCNYTFEIRASSKVGGHVLETVTLFPPGVAS